MRERSRTAGPAMCTCARYFAVADSMGKTKAKLKMTLKLPN